jgi:hypothetical protein
MSRLARPLISKKRLGLAVMALGAMQGVAAGPAHAGGLGSGTLTASGTITAACCLSDSTMSFGLFGGITDLAGDTAAPTASSPVGWNCTNGTTGTFAALADNAVGPGPWLAGSGRRLFRRHHPHGGLLTMSVQSLPEPTPIGAKPHGRRRGRPRPSA